MNLRSWMPGLLHRCISGRCMLSRFGLLGICERERLLPDRRSRFAHRLISLWLALQWIFPRFRSRMLGLRTFVVRNRLRPDFPLRFGFRFRQLVDSFFCQMTGFLHGMVGGVRDFAALIAILRLPVLRRLAQLLPKLLKGSICAAAERCLRRGFEGFDGSRFQRRFFFYLPHYDACSTRSDIFVVIS